MNTNGHDLHDIEANSTDDMADKKDVAQNEDEDEHDIRSHKDDAYGNDHLRALHDDHEHAGDVDNDDIVDVDDKAHDVAKHEVDEKCNNSDHV